MSFLRSRAEQLAEHLRGQIQRGELSEPLPNTRDWAGQLSVGCNVLYEALHTLARENWVLIHPRRGVSLNPNRPAAGAGGQRIVRLVQRGVDYPDLAISSHLWGLISQRLQAQGIQFSVENCTDQRLRDLSRCDPSPRLDPHVAPDMRRGIREGELMLLRSLSEEYQHRFWQSGQSVLVIGYVSPRVPLPFITSDLEGAIRHATHAFLRRGYRRLHLLINRVSIPAVERQCEAFVDACADWAQQPVVGRVWRVPLSASAQITAIGRFASQAREREAIIVVGAVSAGGVMTALLGRRLRIPQQIELVVVDGPPSSLVVCPPPMNYAVSIEALVRQITRTIVHYFQTGAVPPVRKILPMKLVKPGQRTEHRLPSVW